MDRPPRITDESVLSRWMSLEMGRINQGIVEERKTLAELLQEETPAAVTTGGNEYRFRREVLVNPGETRRGRSTAASASPSSSVSTRT